ncbi:hypothetical protein [Jiangella rhizosphaerae]|nr:hypothetical protein [Jiangella rhizosphaerae]
MTEHDAVDRAPHRLAGVPLTKDFLLGLRGVGWGADLGELRPAAVVSARP